MSAITAAFSFIFNLDSWKSLGSASSSSCLETRSVKYSCLPATNHQHLHLDHHDQLLHHLQDRTRSSPSPDPQTSTRAQDSLLWQGPEEGMINTLIKNHQFGYLCHLPLVASWTLTKPHSHLVRVDKDEAVIGVEAAGGELLLDCLARQLGRTSDLVGVMVMIISTVRCSQSRP